MTLVRFLAAVTFAGAAPPPAMPPNIHDNPLPPALSLLAPRPPPVRRRAGRGRPSGGLALDRPMAEPLSRGGLFVDYPVEGVRLLPVFGQAALKVVPPVGHIHVTVDGAGWSWEDGSGAPI